MSRPSTCFKGTFQDVGTGPALLCLAGFGCDSWIFEAMIADLSADFRLIIPDNRGMGASPSVQDSYTIQDLAQDALDLLDDLELDHCHVLGISMGGFIAQALCLAAPNRVDRLMLFCTTSSHKDFVPVPIFSEADLEAGYATDPEQAALKSAAMTTHPRFQEENKEAFQWIISQKIRRRAALDQVKLQARAVSAFLEQKHPIEKITSPTLIMSGDADRFVDPRNSQRLAEILPNATVRLIPQTDHLFFLEKPNGVHDAIRTFLKNPTI